jgi:glycerol-3-phosphate acyltransferase PlsY
MEKLTFIAWIVFSYLLGSVPTGLLIGLYGFGVDVRKSGSGNIGFTNTFRVLGLVPALLVLASDMLKGIIPTLAVVVSYRVAPSIVYSASSASVGNWLLAGVAIAAILGNNFSLYLGFRGGKGIGISAGALFIIVPKVVLALFVIWLAVFLVWRYVSLASLVITLLFPILITLIYPGIKSYLVLSLVTALLVLVRHRSNIQRLVDGRELRLSREGK